MPDANATVGTCRACSGWTLVIVNSPDDTDAERRDNAKWIAEAVKNGRDIHTMTLGQFRDLKACGCPRPTKRGRK